MSRKKVILITGSNGEIGKNLIDCFAKHQDKAIVSLDLQPTNNQNKVFNHITGSILDKELLENINADYEIDEIYHLAAILSTKAEFSPIIANDVNVNGTVNLIKLAIDQAVMSAKPVKFFFPSSIAIYGGINRGYNQPIKEEEFLNPKTIYGINKLYCEQLGVYFSKNYHRLSKDYHPGMLDFRSIRFPGLISISTNPSGGTSDYLPDMLHAAAKNKTYSCFVNSESQLPFMVMSDAIEATIKLMKTEKKNLKNYIYNISAFSPTVAEFLAKIKIYYKDFKITYDINEKRQNMIDGWPSTVDCSKALYDWDWKPKYNLDTAFSEYFIPHLKSKKIIEI